VPQAATTASERPEIQRDKDLILDVWLSFELLNAVEQQLAVGVSGEQASRLARCIVQASLHFTRGWADFCW
jgi:hypothetical protein